MRYAEASSAEHIADVPHLRCDLLAAALCCRFLLVHSKFIPLSDRGRMQTRQP